MNKIELHWETRNEYVLTANELKSLEEKHRREIERRKKEEEEKKKKNKAQINDLQSRGGISQNFVAPIYSSKPESSLNNKNSELQRSALNPNKAIPCDTNKHDININKAVQGNSLNQNKGASLGLQSMISKNNKL